VSSRWVGSHSGSPRDCLRCCGHSCHCRGSRWWSIDGGGRSVGEVAVDSAIAVVHGTDEASGASLLLLATFALKAAAGVVAELMRVTIAVAATGAVRSTPCRRGYVAGVLRGALTVTVAKLFLPALAGARAVLLLAGVGEVLWRRRSAGLHGRNGLAGRLRLVLVGLRAGCSGRFCALSLPLATAAATALGLTHTVGDV
jgi:hypothetical protein